MWTHLVHLQFLNFNWPTDNECAMKDDEVTAAIHSLQQMIELLNIDIKQWIKSPHSAWHTATESVKLAYPQSEFTHAQLAGNTLILLHISPNDTYIKAAIIVLLD